MGFAKSKFHGDVGESFVLSFLESLGFEASKNSDLTTRSDYDIICKMGRKTCTIEVKFDKMAAKTNNVAIEVFNPKSNKESGINITKADLWFHLIPDGNNITCWFNKTSNIIDFISSNKPNRVVDFSGDGNATIYLYPIDDILNKILFRLENLSLTNAKKKIKEVLE